MRELLIERKFENFAETPAFIEWTIFNRKFKISKKINIGRLQGVEVIKRLNILSAEILLFIFIDEKRNKVYDYERKIVLRLLNEDKYSEIWSCNLEKSKTDSRDSSIDWIWIEDNKKLDLLCDNY